MDTVTGGLGGLLPATQAQAVWALAGGLLGAAATLLAMRLRPAWFGIASRSAAVRRLEETLEETKEELLAELRSLERSARTAEGPAPDRLTDARDAA